MSIWKIIRNVINHKKQSLPAEYQVDIVCNKFSKQQLIGLQNKYILQGNHYDLIGTAFRNMKEFDLSEKAYLKAIELFPEFENSYANLISLYILQRKYDLCDDIYGKASRNISDEHKRSVVIYQDGRLQFAKGKYSTALMAARSVLTVENFQHEGAFVLAIHSLLSLIKEQVDVEHNYGEALKMWKFGLSIFTDSKDLNEFAKYFTT